MKPRENKTKLIRIRNVKVMVLGKKKKSIWKQICQLRLWSVGVYLGKGGRRTGPSPTPALVTKAATVGGKVANSGTLKVCLRLWENARSPGPGVER